MVQKLCQLYKSSGIIPLAPTKIGIIKLNDLIYLLNQTNVRKIENRSKIGKTERGRETLPAAHLGHLPVAGPAPPAGPAHLLPPPCLLPPLAPKQLGGERRCRLGHLLLRRGSLPASLLDARRRHATPSDPLTLPRGPAPLLPLSRPNPSAAVAAD